MITQFTRRLSGYVRFWWRLCRHTRRHSLKLPHSRAYSYASKYAAPLSATSNTASSASSQPSRASADKIICTLSRAEAVETLNQILYKGSTASDTQTEAQKATSNKIPSNPVIERLRRREYRFSYADTLNSLTDSAFLYERQGRLSEAEELYKRAILICQHSFGESHLSLVSPLSGLAALYQSQHRYSEAEPLLQQALRIYLQDSLPE